MLQMTREALWRNGALGDKWWAVIADGTCKEFCDQGITRNSLCITRLKLREEETSMIKTVHQSSATYNSVPVLHWHCQQIWKREQFRATYDTSAATHCRICEIVDHVHNDSVPLVGFQKRSRKHAIDEGGTTGEAIGSDVGWTNRPSFRDYGTMRHRNDREGQNRSLWKKNHVKKGRMQREVERMAMNRVAFMPVSC